jgi:hypothetical protein
MPIQQPKKLHPRPKSPRPTGVLSTSTSPDPRIPCFDGHETISCLVEYSRWRIPKPKVYPTTWQPFRKRKKQVEEEETPKPVVRLQPIREGQSVDSFLAGPSSSSSPPAAPQDPGSDAILDPSCTHPELTDPRFLSLLFHERQIEEGWQRSAETERSEREALVKSLSPQSPKTRGAEGSGEEEGGEENG